MSIEQRIRYLLGAATRIEGEGDERTARILRRMAEEARPLEPPRRDDPALRLTLAAGSLECCPE